MAKGKKHNLKWIKETLDLQPGHHWQSKPGYKIFVAGRGAVRFDVPADWVFEPDEKSFRFLDGEPPNDNARLEVSFNKLPPADWSLVPLKPLLKQVVEDDHRNVISRSEIFTVKRQTAQIVWTELKFIDTQEAPREAFSRICIGLGSNVQCLITFEYWADEAEKMTPVWDEVLQSLTLGLYIRDPMTGTAFPD
ncbi:MAG: hypothetical protein EDM05_037120 [Leptolyngbya sp. IPPAS B-1204]|uniref:Uncharacterized protein n=1 Tax=Leptolyngbya sp. NK1-12 TaxID=2547451 RepID=A0AA96WF06_9CYAN|nr:hypothetical protein [Leptolyngbya sp. NK1-12]MBF2047777.1 hypothetical protein [Elainella sp. C42_A2020_010]RNJ68966.1 MAG: hypothetical protein EDM05_12120 [Leptolyngbya sp. IPPAS B-1204]WNZ23989.1 hypothetical protein HJG54_14745 [Leptolyngbya sp. NK1-12]